MSHLAPKTQKNMTAPYFCLIIRNFCSRLEFTDSIMTQLEGINVFTINYILSYTLDINQQYKQYSVAPFQ